MLLAAPFGLPSMAGSAGAFPADERASGRMRGS